MIWIYIKLRPLSQISLTSILERKSFKFKIITLLKRFKFFARATEVINKTSEVIDEYLEVGFGSYHNSLQKVIPIANRVHSVGQQAGNIVLISLFSPSSADYLREN